MKRKATEHLERTPEKLIIKLLTNVNGKTSDRKMRRRVSILVTGTG
jgi:hypothetical protein